jgi:hypothetical protein
VVWKVRKWHQFQLNAMIIQTEELGLLQNEELVQCCIKYVLNEDLRKRWMGRQRSLLVNTSSGKYLRASFAINKEISSSVSVNEKKLRGLLNSNQISIHRSVIITSYLWEWSSSWKREEQSLQIGKEHALKKTLCTMTSTFFWHTKTKITN